MRHGPVIGLKPTRLNRTPAAGRDKRDETTYLFTADWHGDCGLVFESKYKDTKGFGENIAGHILLQDHGFPVSFKNIRIRRLDNPADRVK